MARTKGSKSKKQSEQPGNGGIRELLNELWEAAVSLRGSIEPADYKRYVLPIIFLRFLSLRYDHRRLELEKLLDDPKSEYYTTDAKIRADVLSDPDEYRAGGAFIVPEAARWENIIKVAPADDIKTKLDDILQHLEDTYPDKLKGLLPRIYAGSNLDAEGLRGLINLFSKEVFRLSENGEDLIGRVYEYFIGEFANSEGKRGGEFFTPVSIVKTLVAMLEPTHGSVYDPCCGSGGMFVQSDLFTKHNKQLSFFGQETKDFTYRLCRMNLFIHGLDGKIEIGSSYDNDKHATLKADYIIANPPFNDGSKSEGGWGAHRITNDDPRLDVDGVKLPLAAKNANSMWMLHFLNHLSPRGTAGFVMATGELSNGETNRLEVRKTLIERDYVDCVVQLTGQLFANTQIPCCLWFISRNRDGAGGFRNRKGKILFIDGRKLGALIPGSRKQKQLSEEEVEQIAAVYREFKKTGDPAEVPGFCKVASLDEVKEHRYALTPGRYVGAAEGNDEDEPFEERWPRLVEALRREFGRSAESQKLIEGALQRITHGS